MMKGTFELADFVFDCDSVDSRDGSYNLCWHRGGRVVGFILPFFVSGGGNAASKIKQIAGVTVDASEIQKVVNVIKQGYQPHHTIKRPGRRQLVVEGPDNTITMTIDEHGKVTTIIEKSTTNKISDRLKDFPSIKNKELTISESGKIYGRFENGEIIYTGNTNNIQRCDFIVTTNGEVLVGSKHTFLSKGESVIAAGELKLRNGIVVEINNASGHYLPTIDEASNYLRIFRELGVNVDKATLTILKEDGTTFIRVLPNHPNRSLYY